MLLEPDMLDGTALPALPTADPMDQSVFVAMTYLSGFANPNTRAAYGVDLRLYFEWCAAQHIRPLEARRLHLQAFAIHLLEVRRNAPASVSRRMGTLSGFYECAVLDGVLEHSPAHHLKLPKIHDDPSSRTWLNRFELGALLHTALNYGAPADWALVTLMGTIGMRVTATCNVRVEDLSKDSSGYRFLHTVGKGGKPSTKVLPIPTWPAIDRAADGRTSGWLLLRRDGSQMNRRSAAVVVKRLCVQAGIEKEISPHCLRRSFATLALRSGVDLRIVQQGMDHSNSRTTLGYDALGVEPHSAASNTVAALLASTS